MTDPRQELESALAPLAWVLNFIWGTIQLMFWFFMFPFLIVCWCFYHPAEARVYFVSAIPLLWNGSWATRGLLAFFRASYRELVWEDHAQDLLGDRQACSRRWLDLVHLHDLQAGVILTPP